MRKLYSKPGPGLFPLACIVLLLISSQANSQKRQLTASAKVVKIAYIDQLALRKQYKAFSDTKRKLADENMIEKKSYDQAIQLLDKRTVQLIKQDSLAGGANRLQILNGASSKKGQFTFQHLETQKVKNTQRITLMNDYEKKIQLAIESVVIEGGFTDVQPIDKNTTIKNGKDITDLVLKKLN
jgi:Skp family chaperone for outer membrane proteins